jgi:hypothetical protein
MPTLGRWLAAGSHRLSGWEADLPCQTAASQAGILHATNIDIPAFRWLDKESRRVFVANNPKDARDIERRLSNGRGLLADGGASRSNMFSGDASDTMMTFSTVLQANNRRGTAYAAYLSDPVNVARTLVLMLVDVFLELRAQLMVHVHGRSRAESAVLYPLVRAVTTTLRDVAVYTLIGDMLRGCPPSTPTSSATTRWRTIRASEQTDAMAC